MKNLTILGDSCGCGSSSVNTFVMYPPKPFMTKLFMSLLTVSLALGVRFGNGLILAVIARFKSFRTVPNILAANIAVVDMLNPVINTPIYMISSLLEAGWFTGQGLATGRERQLTTGKRAERTKHDFRCSICRSAIGQGSCLICTRHRRLTFPFCC